jgi:hypothetical protein
MQKRKFSLVFVAIALGTCWSAGAQEFAHEIMTGGRTNAPASSSARVLAYGGDEQTTFPPRASHRARSPDIRTAAYCVRSCDGRYFPAPPVDKNGVAGSCMNLCPSGETQVFYGRSIDGAHSQKGQAYSDLPNAFRYRKELVAGCTCNGKDVVGLARIKPEDDATLRQGDLLASADGMKVVRRIGDGEPRFAATPTPVSSR